MSTRSLKTRSPNRSLVRAAEQIRAADKPKRRNGARPDSPALIPAARLRRHPADARESIGRPVDLAGKDRLRPGVAAEAEKDQILAF